MPSTEHRTLLQRRVEHAFRQSLDIPPGQLPDRTLAVQVEQWRDVGYPWRHIAWHVQQATGMDVTGETLRAWYGS